MTNLQHLEDALRRKALASLSLLDEAWQTHGLPKAMELHGEAAIRAEVQYQAAVDIEAVRKGAVELHDFVRELEALAGPTPIPSNRMAALCKQIAREEARAILDRLRQEPVAVVH